MSIIDFPLFWGKITIVRKILIEETIMSEFLRLLGQYLSLPFAWLWEVILKPVGGFISENWSKLIAWLPTLLPWAIGAGVLVVTILELVFEGWVLRRFSQIRNAWLRRPLVLFTVVAFYIIACAQMAAASLAFGLGVQWYVWIVVTVLHVVTWLLNIVFRNQFARAWKATDNTMQRMLPKKARKPVYGTFRLTVNQGSFKSAAYTELAESLKKDRLVNALVDSAGALIIVNKDFAQLSDGTFTVGKNLQAA